MGVHQNFVKGVRAQDGWTPAAEFVAWAVGVAGVVCRRTNGEGDEIERERDRFGG